MGNPRFLVSGLLEAIGSDRHKRLDIAAFPTGFIICLLQTESISWENGMEEGLIPKNNSRV